MKVNLVARKQGVQMRDVPMMNFRRLQVPVLQPFLKLSRLADLQGREARARGGDLRAEFRIHAENFRCLDAVGEQVAQNFHVHRRPGADAGMAVGMRVLRRQGRTGHQPVVRRVFHQRVEEELRRAFHGGINLFQIIFCRR
jgi:hypothetical protein